MLIIAFAICANLPAQLKHIAPRTEATMTSIGFGASKDANAFEAGIAFTKEGSTAVGLSFIHGASGGGNNGFGVSFEKVLARPVDKAGAGMNLFGTFSTMWSGAQYSGDPSRQGTVFGGGFELYVHTIFPKVNLEPFLQAGYYYGTVTGAGKAAFTGVGGGVDLSVVSTYGNTIVFSFIRSGSEHARPFTGGTLTLCHTFSEKK